jgi:antitoxin PrlF
MRTGDVPRGRAARNRRRRIASGPREVDDRKDDPYFREHSCLDLVVITSKLTRKAQTTIPRPIRAALGLREGDELVYEIQGNRVVLSRAQQVSEGDDPFRTFSEWDSAADRKAYGRL